MSDWPKVEGAGTTAASPATAATRTAGGRPSHLVQYGPARSTPHAARLPNRRGSRCRSAP